MFGLFVDYTLRKRIEKAREQIAGMQDYIRQQCLN